MLNLKDLERRINDVLESETPESLTNWLMSKRATNIESYIGEGDYLPFNLHAFIESDNFELDNACAIVEIRYNPKDNSDNTLSTTFEMAA